MLTIRTRPIIRFVFAFFASPNKILVKIRTELHQVKSFAMLKQSRKVYGETDDYDDDNKLNSSLCLTSRSTRLGHPVSFVSNHPHYIIYIDVFFIKFWPGFFLLLNA